MIKIGLIPILFIAFAFSNCKYRNAASGEPGEMEWRNASYIKYSKHARCRMDCRNIDESEIREILLNGVLNRGKIEESSKGKTYPLEGTTHDQQHVRIVFAPHENSVTVVTVIDLETNWSCNCR